jgi:hypothetical protein
MMPFPEALATLLYPIVPSAASADVRKLCARLSPGQTAITLSVTPEADGEVSFCYQNVERKIARDGGSIQHGWQIWEIPQIWLEAEFHAVWRSPEGDLVDITPKADSSEGILFLPDLHRTYAGKQIFNEYHVISKDPLVNELIAIKRKKYLLLNRGERAHINGEIVLLGDEAREHARIEMREQGVMDQILLNKYKVGRNYPCPCGSGRKYKQCCGR